MEYSNPRSGVRGILKACLILTLSAGVSASPSHARQDVYQELLSEVRDRNLDLQIVSLDTETASNRVKLSGIWSDPMVSTSWSPYRIQTARGSIRSRVSISQQLPFPGYRGLQKEEKRFDVQASGVLYAATRLQKEFKLKLAIDQIFLIQEMNRLVDAFATELERFEDAAVAQYETGSESLSPILNIQNERRYLDLRKQQLDSDLHDQVLTVSSLLNRQVSITEFQHLSERPLSSLSSSDIDMLVEEGLESAPQIKMSDIEITRSDTEIKLSRYDTLPSFTVGIEYIDVASSELTAVATGRDAVSVRMAINVPLGKNRRSVPRELALLQAHKAQVIKESEEVSIAEAIRHLFERYHNLIDQEKLLRTDLIPRAESVSESALSAYTTGRTAFLTVLDSKRTSFNLQVRLLEVINELKVTHASLERQLGRFVEVSR